MLDLLQTQDADLRLTAPLCQLVHTLMAKLQELLPGAAGGGVTLGGGKGALPAGRPYAAGVMAQVRNRAATSVNWSEN